MTALDYTFTAPLEKDGSFPTYITVPGSAELLGTRAAVKVTGTIDGHPFAATAPMARGPTAQRMWSLPDQRGRAASRSTPR